MDQISGMSSEQSLAFSVNNALCPNQIIPPGSVPSWTEPFGAILQPQTVSGQLPLFANNLLLANASILADAASRNAHPFVTFSNGFLANSSVDPWQFNVQPGSPALYPLRMSVGMKGERIDDCSRAAQRAAFED
jgi:hypothetical protein